MKESLDRIDKLIILIYIEILELPALPLFIQSSNKFIVGELRFVQLIYQILFRERHFVQCFLMMGVKFYLII